MGETTERIYKVYIDPVTGLYDRRTMWARLAEEVSRARRYHYPLSLMLVAFGTPEPRQALERLPLLADILKRSTRTSDILARYSEDTLVLLLPCTDEQGALCLAERIGRLALEVQASADVAGEAIPLSIGVTSAHGDFIGDKIALVEQVEWALRKAQEGGEQIVVVPAPRRARSTEEEEA